MATHRSNPTATPALVALSQRLDAAARAAEMCSLVDAEDGIPSVESAQWPTSHPRWLGFLDLLIARRRARGEAAIDLEGLRAELQALSPDALPRYYDEAIEAAKRGRGRGRLGWRS